MYRIVSSVVVCLLVVINMTAHADDIQTIDKIYDENIKTVRLFPLLNNPERELLSSAAPLNGQFTLLLQFDHLYGDYENYFVKFIHCNADWSISRLFPLDYLDDFNEFHIEEYEFSFNTKVPYIHYQFTLPNFKKSGNYLLVVYRDSESDLALTKRFMIYENKFGMMDEPRNKPTNKGARSNQQIQFSLNYTRGVIDNPYRNVKVTIRQNQRWDNAKKLLPPTFANEAAGTIDFRQFGGENEFEAGNEFRFFDLRSLRYFGRNVQTVDLTKQIDIATLEPDKFRGSDGYGENKDLNGKFEIPHPYESDYAFVEYFLELNEPLNGKVYLASALTQWSRDEQFLLEYLAERKGYYGVFLLKQGFYNYQYLVNGSTGLSANYIEGNHSETENEYDILVYYHSFREDIDLLYGYFTLSANPRF